GGAFSVTELKFDPTSQVQAIKQWEHVTIAPRGDVKVVKTAANTPINAGDTATFNIVVTSLGPPTAFNVVLSHVLPTLPSGNTWRMSGTDAAPACNATQPFTLAGGATLTCNFGNLAVGATRTITLAYATTTADCQTVNNTATVSATNDDNSANNSSTA